ncbi:unnamed protein product [Lupinus luteus]|uniref:Uncharacterized protein n=1 Tax=Lupinus luteus TaxID=3873 RepID=A0AAV1YHG0_LUPLU
MLQKNTLLLVTMFHMLHLYSEIFWTLSLLLSTPMHSQTGAPAGIITNALTAQPLLGVQKPGVCTLFPFGTLLPQSSPHLHSGPHSSTMSLASFNLPPVYEPYGAKPFG